MKKLAAVLALLTLCSFGSTAYAADRCEVMEEKFKSEANSSYDRQSGTLKDLSKAARAAIDANGSLQATDRNTQLTSLRKTVECLGAEIGFRNARFSSEEGRKLSKIGCRSKFQLEMDAANLKRYEEEYRSACLEVEDRTQLDRMRERVAAEEKDWQPAVENRPSPAVKKTDASQREGDFCRTIRSVSTEANTLFKAITGKKKDEYFVDPKIKVDDLTEVRTYATPVSLFLDRMSAPSKCEMLIGSSADLFERTAPTYTCRWEYQRITRRELEEKTDMIAALTRGCFGGISEISSKIYRHEFLGDDAVNVAVSESLNNLSLVTIQIRKSTPAEDAACWRYSLKKAPADREICSRKHVRN